MAINFPNSPVLNEVHQVSDGPSWVWNGTTWDLIQQTSDNGADILVYTPAGTGAVATTVKAKLDNTLSLKDFGAVGDGVTDDTVAVQAAFTAAAATSGLVLTGPPGNYAITASITVSSNTRYRGEGAIFLKDYISASGNTNAMFVNSNYADDPTSHNDNIDFDGLRCRNNETTDTGAFISFNWVDGLRLTGLDIIQTASDSWCVHLCGKNIVVSDGKIDTTAVTQYADGLHFEYAENVVIDNMLMDTHDDCIALHYQKSTNSSAGPNLASKNISITNCYLRSDIANSIRIGAGELASVVSVVANAEYDGVTVSNCTMDSSGATGTTIAMYDNTGSSAKHDNILFSNIYIRDTTSASQLIYIVGNDDVTDVANLAVRHYGRIKFDHIICEQSTGGSWISGGGIEDLTVSNSSYVHTTSGTASAIDLRMVDNLTFSNNHIKTVTSGQQMLIRDFQRLRVLDNDFYGTATEYAAVRVDQPNVTSGDSMEVIGNVMRGVARGVTIISAVALDTGYILDNDMGGVSGTKAAATLTYTTGQVQHRGDSGKYTVLINLTSGTTQTQAGATAMTSNYNQVTTHGSVDDGVLLPPCSEGLICKVHNDTATGSLQVWPATGDNINGGSANAVGVSKVQAGECFEYLGRTATSWYITSVSPTA